MIIFLYGQDAYRLDQRKTELLDRYKAKYTSGLNMLHIDGSSEDALTSLADACKSTSFFDEVKLIVLKNMFRKGMTENVHTLLKEQDTKARKDTVILISQEASEKELRIAGKELFTYLSIGTTTGVFDPLAGSGLMKWINEEVQRLGTSISVPAINELVFRTGSNTWTLALNLQKLSNYKGPEQITPQDVALLVASPTESNIFELTDAVGTRNTARAMALLYEQLHRGQDPYYILTMLTYHVRNLLALKDSASDGARLLGLHPFVARKSIDQARGFDLSELKALFSRLADLEQKTKQGTVQLTDELYQVIAN